MTFLRLIGSAEKAADIFVITQKSQTKYAYKMSNSSHKEIYYICLLYLAFFPLKLHLGQRIHRGIKLNCCQRTLKHLTAHLACCASSINLKISMTIRFCIGNKAQERKALENTLLSSNSEIKKNIIFESFAKEFHGHWGIL